MSVCVRVYVYVHVYIRVSVRVSACCMCGSLVCMSESVTEPTRAKDKGVRSRETLASQVGSTPHQTVAVKIMKLGWSEEPRIPRHGADDSASQHGGRQLSGFALHSGSEGKREASAGGPHSGSRPGFPRKPPSQRTCFGPFSISWVRFRRLQPPAQALGKFVLSS